MIPILKTNCIFCNSIVFYEDTSYQGEHNPLATNYWVVEKTGEIKGYLCDSKCSTEWYELNNRRA